MKELRQKQIVKRRLYSTPVLVILLIVTGLIIHSTYKIVQKYRESAGYVDALKQKANDLASREIQLKGDITRLGTDEGIDTEIKEKFNVSKEGERVAIIVDQANNSSNTATSTEHWWKRLWGSIIGH